MLKRMQGKPGNGFSLILVATVVLLILFIVTAQLAIHKGRIMEREEAATKVADAEARAQRLGEMLAVAQDQLEKMPIVQELTYCESSGRHKGVWGDGGKSYGRWQFQEASFLYLADRAGLPGLNWQSQQDQAVVGTWALSNGYASWWTCWKKISKKGARS